MLSHVWSSSNVTLCACLCAAFNIFVAFKSWGGKGRKNERSELVLRGRDTLYTYLDHVVEYLHAPDGEGTALINTIYEDVARIGTSFTLHSPDSLGIPARLP